VYSPSLFRITTLPIVFTDISHTAPCLSVGALIVDVAQGSAAIPLQTDMILERSARMTSRSSSLSFGSKDKAVLSAVLLFRRNLHRAGPCRCRIGLDDVKPIPAEQDFPVEFIVTPAINPYPVGVPID
jgi:hypothetical protein